MCNLYSVTKGQAAIRELTDAMTDSTGNMPPLPGIFPDYSAPIVRNQPSGRELTMAWWGMPTPMNVRLLAAEKRADALRKKGTQFDFEELLRLMPDGGVTNVRNTISEKTGRINAHSGRWLAPGNRCVVPFTSFSENEELSNGSKPPVWFAFNETRPLAFFAGIWTCWTSVRKAKEGESTNDIFGFLTTKANAEVGAIHPKAMPVILRTKEEINCWLTAPVMEALELQRPLRVDVENRIHPNPLIVNLTDACLFRYGRLEDALAAQSPRYVQWRQLWRDISANPDAYREKAKRVLAKRSGA